MRVPISWLRDYVQLPADANEIISRFATLGFPVDAVDTRPTITGVVVGRIDAIEKHPNADRLQVCTIDIGANRKLTIATAATNVAEGQVIPVATIGAKLPELTIEPRKMRGIASDGMLCSGGELALEAAWFEDGIMQLDRDLPLGANVVTLLGLDDPVLDVDVTPNRVDAMSMLGLARELAASFGETLREPATTVTYTGETDDVRVTLESVDARRYVAQRVGGLSVRPAPSWIRVRLALAGQRPINNLVDISNFVMLETGQPLHFFDYEKIANAHIIVRDAKPGERLTTLDGTDRALDPTALLIADETQATGLAGLMGGLISEVSETTREIVIESANFTGPRIRRMSVKLALRSEASTRNEKNLPPALTDLGAARAAVLLAAEGGSVRAPKPFGAQLAAPSAIALPKRDVARLLGFTIDDPTIVRALQSLGFAVDDRGTAFAVTAPPWRSDIAIPADLVEEIARVVGYDRIEAVMPSVGLQPLASEIFERDNALAATLAGLGYHECMTLGLQPAAIADRDRALGFEVPAAVEIANPLSDDQRYLRYSILHAHLAMVARDRVRPYRTFEIGHVFADAQPVPTERNVALVLAATPRVSEPVWRSTPFAALLADTLAAVRALTARTPELERTTAPLLHPGKTAALTLDGVRVATVGVIDPRLMRAYGIDDDVVAAEIAIEALPKRAIAAFAAPSRFPAVERDLAIVVDAATAAGVVLTAVRAHAGVRSAEIFDEYRGAQVGAEKKSLAIRVLLQRDDATLTDAIADETIAAIIEDLKTRTGAILRG
jgi:phenylalanyl-tRNA synthetase beta chain